MDKKSSLISYAMLIYTLYATGSIFFISFNYNIAITALLILSLIFFFVIPKKYHGENNSASIIILISLPTLILLTFITSSTTLYTPYIAIIMQVVSGFFISLAIPQNKFKEYYVNILSVLAAISLVCYFLILVRPSVMLNFPKTSGTVSLDYYNAIVYVFGSSKGYGSGSFVPFKRNNGIFWEPGAHQAFLNVALMFLFDKEDFGKDKYDLFKGIVLIAAVVTTFSTTGYIIMAIIVIMNLSKLSRAIGDNSIKGFAAVMIMLMVAFFIGRSEMGSFMSSKLSTEFGEGGNFTNRLFLGDIEILFEGIRNFFFGISFEQYEERNLFSGNSVFQTMACIGVPFTAIILSMYFKFCQHFKNYGLLYFMFFIMIFFTESLLWRPMFLCMGWYGILDEPDC